MRARELDINWAFSLEGRDVAAPRTPGKLFGCRLVYSWLTNFSCPAKLGCCPTNTCSYNTANFLQPNIYKAVARRANAQHMADDGIYTAAGRDAARRTQLLQTQRADTRRRDAA